MMTETLTTTEPQSAELGTLLQEWAETPPTSLTAALSEKGVDVEALENYARSGISNEELETLRRVLVAAAASGQAEDAALLARFTPILDPRERSWDRLLKARSSGEVISAVVTEAVKGGLVVDLGVRGFVPASQVGLSVPRNLSQYVGRTLKLRVLELDRRRGTVILSNRQVQEEERATKRRSALERLEEGQERTGVVRRLTDIGAFVDVGGVDGLLHVSEISWKRVDHPSDVLKVGQKIQVKVLRVDPDAGRVSLSARRLTMDPWEAVRTKYAVGTVVHGKIAQIVPQGAVLGLDEDVEGFIPIGELSPRRIATPEEAVQVGQEVDAVVMDIRFRERRIVLSIRKLEQKKERQEIDTYQKKARRTSDRTTLGDLFGHLFEEYMQDEQEQEGEGETAPAAVAEGDEAAAVAATAIGDETPGTDAVAVEEAGADEAAADEAGVDEAGADEASVDEAGVTAEDESGAPLAAVGDDTSAGDESAPEEDASGESAVGDAVSEAPAAEPDVDATAAVDDTAEDVAASDEEDVQASEDAAEEVK